MRTPRSKILSFALGLIFLLSVGSTEVKAQSTTWIGGELGDPSGLVLRPDYDGRGSLEFLAAWDLDEFFFLNVHRMIETPIEPNRPLYFMFGPGAFVGFEDNGDDEAILGISGRFGVGYGGRDYRIYLSVTPRLSLTPDTDGQVGGGLGVLFRL
ncbi:MAG: hypothetical protein JJ896_03680 [Rhodothermales bacterium]|nr:hypothetical protein [Rhodothermales bacterium]MBO6778735.1 hypothetical protein [Rhodothermales bacterium]